MTLRAFVQQLTEQQFIDGDGHTRHIELLPPLTAAERVVLEAHLPCPLPPDVHDLLSHTRGLAKSPLDIVDFAGYGGATWTELFPTGFTLAEDGFGNGWVVDLVPTSTHWGPIFYVSHDPPVIVYQSPDLQTFLADMIRLWISPYNGPVDDVHESGSAHIWRTNPGMIPVAEWRQSPDDLQRAFAETLDHTFLCIDLRQARIGEGFSWGRYGPRTVNTRFGWHRLFAYQQRKRWWQRLLSR